MKKPQTLNENQKIFNVEVTLEKLGVLYIVVHLLFFKKEINSDYMQKQKWLLIIFN